eukprot:gene21191-23920_t
MAAPAAAAPQRRGGGEGEEELLVPLAAGGERAPYFHWERCPAFRLPVSARIRAATGRAPNPRGDDHGGRRGAARLRPVALLGAAAAVSTAAWSLHSSLATAGGRWPPPRRRAPAAAGGASRATVGSESGVWAPSGQTRPRGAYSSSWASPSGGGDGCMV